MRKILPWLFSISFLGLLLAAAYLPLPVEPYLDFQVVYHAGMGLLRGIPLYDQPGQVMMIADLAGVSPEQVFVLPFPYPPWYALTTLPLVFLPVEAAARLWLELNVAMLMLSVWLVTQGWKPRKRLAAFPFALIFLPVLGALFVGQYVFPVLLGAVLFAYGLQREKALLAVIGAALLTFKPHLGGLALLAGLVNLWLRRDAFGRSTLWYSIVAGVFLFGVGFLADPLWPVNYFRSLTGFRSVEGVSSCELCASLPVMISNQFGPGGIGPAFWIGGSILLGLAALIQRKRPRLWSSPVCLVTAFILVTLLASPYLLNYDFVLLLLPLSILAGQSQSWQDWVLVGVIFILPWLGFGLLGRQGNGALILSALFLALVLYRRTANQLDSPTPSLYNQQNSLREE